MCREAQATATGVSTGMGPGDLPDLGGEHFVLLHPPRIAVLGREPVSPYGYGEVWYTIYHTLGLRASYIDASNLGGADLRRYNVLVIPDEAGRIIKDHMDDVKAWATGWAPSLAVTSTAKLVRPAS